METTKLESTLTDLLARVDAQRVAQLTFDLVRIPSPTTEEKAIAEFYADVLREIGLEVEIDRTLPNSPNVIGRRRGATEGRTLQLAGHLDAIPVEHPEPYFRDGVISGRGAADMKSGLAAIAEAVRVLVESGRPLPGNLLVTAYGRHEAPLGQGEGLRNLIDNGVVGDAAIVAEGPHDELPIVGKGQAVYEFVIRRGEEAFHELMAPEGVVHPIWAGREVLNRIAAKNAELAQTDLPYLGPETIFVGQFHSGDFYNRVPTTCRIVGTRRWGPQKRFADVEAELQALAAQAAADLGIRVEAEVRFTGEAFELSPDEPIVQAARQGYQMVVGRELPLVGMSLLGDVSRLMQWGQVPAIYMGTDQTTAHSDGEKVHVDSIVRAARCYLAAALCYWGG